MYFKSNIYILKLNQSIESILFNLSLNNDYLSIYVVNIFE